MENTKTLIVKELVEQLLKVNQDLPVNISAVGFNSKDSWDAPLQLEEHTVDIYKGVCRINFSIIG